MRSTFGSELLRSIPSLDDLLRHVEVSPLMEREGRPAVAQAARAVLQRVREEITAGRLDAENLELALAGLPSAIERQLRQDLGYSLRPVINATGVLLHTNLGRAPLAASALQHISQIAATYCNLEYDLAAGKRGRRDVHLDRLFRQLLREPGAPVPSTVVVNNNAAAVLLALNSLAEGGEVVVSRGELVEIGGSFRIPEVMLKSGAILREVGTTNRTRLADYERAINEKTRLLLRVHRSNFQITGFTQQPSLQQLAELARKRGIPLMEDLGSGALFDLSSVGISGEPGVRDSLRAGVEVVSYSGDKLLGGPQAGMLSGGKELIARMRANSLFRALRVDKLTYAALEATLLAYVKQDHDSIPALSMMRVSQAEIERRAVAVAARSRSAKLTMEVVDGESVIGGGAAPSAALATRLLALNAPALSADELASRLRSGEPPVIARVEEGRVLLDLRTVLPPQDELLAAALLAAVA